MKKRERGGVERRGESLFLNSQSWIFGISQRIQKPEMPKKKREEEERITCIYTTLVLKSSNGHRITIKRGRRN